MTTIADGPHIMRIKSYRISRYSDLPGIPPMTRGEEFVFIFEHVNIFNAPTYEYKCVIAPSPVEGVKELIHATILDVPAWERDLNPLWFLGCNLEAFIKDGEIERFGDSLLIQALNHELDQL